MTICKENYYFKSNKTGIIEEFKICKNSPLQKTVNKNRENAHTLPNFEPQTWKHVENCDSSQVLCRFRIL